MPLLFGILYKQDVVMEVYQSEGDGDEETECDKVSVHLKYMVTILIMWRFFLSF